MKIKSIFEFEEINNELIMVSLDSDLFNGLIKVNDSAAFIINCLKEETNEKDIVNKMVEYYQINKDEATKGLNKVLLKLKELNLLIP